MTVFRPLIVTALASPLLLMPTAAPGACAEPTIDLSRTSVDAGRVVVVRGEAWMDGCDDESAGGCFDDRRPAEPLDDVRVALERRGVAIQETTATTNQDGEFEVRVHTEGLVPGSFRVVARHGDSLSVGENLTVRARD